MEILPQPKKINLKSGTICLSSASSKALPFCRIIAKAAQLWGEVAEVSLKGVFRYYRFGFLFWTVCLIPAHTRYECRFDIDPETLQITNYRQFPVEIADQWYFPGGIK